MLDSAIKEQLKGLFAQLDAHYTFDIFVHPRHESRAELVDLLKKWLLVPKNSPVVCKRAKV